MPRVALALAPALTLALALASSEASAYCRATTCKTSDTCQGDCGIPLAWRRDCVGVSLHRRASSSVGYVAAEAKVSSAFRSWHEADCGGGSAPGVFVQNLGAVSCDRVEYNLDAANQNLIVFRDDGWDRPDASHNLALTTLTFDRDTGEIYDADIEINTADHEFVAGGFELVDVLTHEAGHFFGLAHSPLDGTTMFATYTPGTSIATLQADDVEGICAVYPPKGFDRDRCNPIPRHGFSTECADDQRDAPCSAAPIRGGRRASGWLAAGLLLVAAGLRRAGLGARSRARRARFDGA